MATAAMAVVMAHAVHIPLAVVVFCQLVAPVRVVFPVVMRHGAFCDYHIDRLLPVAVGTRGRAGIGFAGVGFNGSTTGYDLRRVASAPGGAFPSGRKAVQYRLPFRKVPGWLPRADAHIQLKSPGQLRVG